jgi:DNA-binding transcriptional ArsR family regulator
MGQTSQAEKIERYDAVVRDAAIAMRRLGAEYAEIATALGVSEGWVADLIERHANDAAGVGGRLAMRDACICALARAGESKKSIATTFDLTPTQVGRILKKNGLTIKRESLTSVRRVVLQQETERWERREHLLRSRLMLKIERRERALGLLLQHLHQGGASWDEIGAIVGVTGVTASQWARTKK